MGKLREFQGQRLKRFREKQLMHFKSRYLILVIFCPHSSVQIVILSQKGI